MFYQTTCLQAPQCGGNNDGDDDKDYDIYNK
jgi:hypothetical protein